MSATFSIWLGAMASQNMAQLSDLLSEQVVFHPPEPGGARRGRPAALAYLREVVDGLGSGSFQYLREIEGEYDAAFVFTQSANGFAIDGVHLINWNVSGRIIDMKVMTRQATPDPTPRLQRPA